MAGSPWRYLLRRLTLNALICRSQRSWPRGRSERSAIAGTLHERCLSELNIRWLSSVIRVRQDVIGSDGARWSEVST